MLVEALGTTAHSSAFLFIDAIDPRGTVNAGVYERIGRVFDRDCPLRAVPWRVAGRGRRHLLL